MRRVEIVAGLSIGFPGRSAEFIEGVEIGLVAAALASGWARMELKIGAGTLEQARELANGMGYRILGVTAEPDGVQHTVTFATGAAKPRLQLVK